MDGYILLLRGKSGAGECGILSGPPSYPQVSSTIGAEACSGSGDPAGAGVCYSGAAGIGPLKETVKVNLEKYASGAGTMKLAGSGIVGFTCGDHSFTKSGQDIKADLSDCLPSGITLETVKYCSDDDTG